MERQTLRTEVDLSVIAELPSGSGFLAIRTLRYCRSHELHRLILPEGSGFVGGIRCLPDDQEENDVHSELEYRRAGERHQQRS